MDETIDLARSTARRPKFDGVSTGEWSKPTWADYISVYDGEVDGTPTVADAPQGLKNFAAGTSLLGDANADTFAELVVLPVAEPSTGRLNLAALRNAISRAPQLEGFSESAVESAHLLCRNLLEDNSDSKATTGFIFVDLADLTPGKSFDGLLAGTFLDMNLREVPIPPEDLPEIVANTNALIEEKRTESGELVGLPIDEKSHNKGDAAGWIVGAELVGDVLKIVPKWTELGIEKIGKGIQRFFSATLDLKNKVIIGGTLTNWPAIKSLRPIELQEGIYKLQGELLDEDSFQARIEKVERAWHSTDYMPLPTESESWPMRVFEDFLLLKRHDRLWQVLYSIDEAGEIEFASEEDWTEVKRGYVEAQGAEYGAFELTGKSEVIEMEMTTEELNATVAQQVNSAVDQAFADFANKIGIAGDGKDAPAGQAAEVEVNLMEILGLQDMEEEAQERIEAAMTRQLESVRKSAEMRWMQKLARVERKRQYAEFCQRTTGGTNEVPRGLRGTTADELQEFMLRLEPDDAEYIQRVLEANLEHGFVQFEELGHGKTVHGQKSVPAYAQRALKEALADGADPEEFFEVAGLGDAAEYDLSEFMEASNG